MVKIFRGEPLCVRAGTGGWPVIVCSSTGKVTCCLGDIFWYCSVCLFQAVWDDCLVERAEGVCHCLVKAAEYKTTRWHSLCYLQCVFRGLPPALGRRLVLGKGMALSLTPALPGTCWKAVWVLSVREHLPFGWYMFRQGAHCLVAGPLAVSKINTIVLLRLALIRNAVQGEGTQWWAVGSLCQALNACVCGLPPGTGLPFWLLLLLKGALSVMERVRGKGWGTVCDGLPDARLWLAGGSVSSLGPGAFTMQSQWEMLLLRRLISCCRKALVFPWPVRAQCCPTRFHADSPLTVEVTRKMPVFVAHFTALAWHQCRDTSCCSLNVQVLLLWRAITRRHHLLACDHLNFIAYHVKHTFEDYITQQTYVQHNANAQSASTSQLWTTSWLKLLQFAFLFKGFHQSGMLNRCQCNYLSILWHPLFKDAFSASDTLITS